MTSSTTLEENHISTVEKELAEFLLKGGTFQAVRPFDLDRFDSKKITLYPNDAVYTACSAGFCRSQTLWALLKPYQSNLVLFPPHATRYGLDPYNGKPNWNHDLGGYGDEFHLYFDECKSIRFGYPEFEKYSLLKDEEASQSVLDELSSFFNAHYFGEQSSWQGKKGTRRVYLVFAANAHTVMYRLNQSNQDLRNAIVYFIDSDDYITKPKPEWNVLSRSKEAYQKFAEILEPILDLSHL